jgi:rhodanese-related sulfurtransferase
VAAWVAADEKIAFIEVAELRACDRRHAENLNILDVRTADEYARLAGAVWAPGARRSRRRTNTSPCAGADRPGVRHHHPVGDD